MKRLEKIDAEKKKMILIHSADKDMAKSLSSLLQDQYGIILTQTAEEFSLQRNNTCISLLVVDVERSIPELLAEFELRRQASSAPIIVLYAYRQGQPEWEKKIRLSANEILYKPVPTEKILEAIAAENKLHSTV